MKSSRAQEAGATVEAGWEVGERIFGLLTRQTA